MISDRNRLLLLLVLLSVVAAAGWSTAFADGRAATPSAASSLASVSKPPAAPTSGEPDVGQTPHPLAQGSMSPVPRGKGAHTGGPATDPWLRWIFRMWANRYLGAR